MRPVVIALERFTSNTLEIYKQIPIPDDTGSPKVQGLSTSWSSPELLMVEVSFTAC